VSAFKSWARVGTATCVVAVVDAAPPGTLAAVDAAGDADETGNAEAALAKFAANCARAEPKQIWMRLGVIGNYVAAGGSFPKEIGTLANEASDHEKRGAGFVLCKEIEKFRS